MFLYLFHKLNHSLFKSKNKSDGALNVRTIMFGGIAYILFHAFINSSQMKNYFFKDYFWWLMLLDIFVMGIIYKMYYNRSMFKELKQYDTDIYVEDKHIYIPKNNKNTNINNNNDTNINNNNDTNKNNNTDTNINNNNDTNINNFDDVNISNSNNIILEASLKNILDINKVETIKN